MTGEYSRAGLARLEERLHGVREGLQELATQLRSLADQARAHERAEHAANVEREREITRIATLVDTMEKRVHKTSNVVQQNIAKIATVENQIDQAKTAPHAIVPANSGPVYETQRSEAQARTRLWAALAAFVLGLGAGAKALVDWLVSR